MTVKSGCQLLSETLIGLAQAGRQFPRTRRGRSEHPTPSAILRWVRNGVQAPDGRRVYLEAILVSGRWLTSVQAIERYVLAQQPQSGNSKDSADTSVSSTVIDGQQMAAKAGLQLQQLGL